MSRWDFVAEEPLQLAPGVSEMLRDPNHYRRSPMAIVDYGEPEPGQPAPLPSLSPRNWPRFILAAVRGGR